MKAKILSLIVLCSILIWTPKVTAQAAPKDSITVYIFLHESCRISQYYSLPLRKLHEQYANEYLQFVGVFPSPNSTSEKIKAFKDAYNIPFTLEADHYHQRTEALGATVTPQVVVFNETDRDILYTGRIDDSYARVGQRKRVNTSSELKDVLEAIKNNTPILSENAPAIGCFIGKNKLH